MTQSALADFKQALATPNQSLSDEIAKVYSQSASATSGLTFYDLEAPAKSLFPVITPLRNRIPRVVGGRGIQANWRAITGINTGGVLPGVSEGNRNAAIAHTTADYLAAFVALGLDDYVTFEADYAAEGFDDVKARAVENLLRALMISEEFTDLGGNNSVPFTAGSATPSPSLSAAATGGALEDSTAYYVAVVPLTLSGYQQLKGWNNGVTGQSGTIGAGTLLHQTITRTNMSGESETINGGVGRKSATISQSTDATAPHTHTVSATVAAVSGAVAYAWYFGTVGACYLHSVTTINSQIFTGLAATTQNITALADTDYSTDSLVYDGILTQVMKSGSGAYVKNLATGTPGTGTKLTTDNAGGITEIEAAFVSFYQNYRLSPDTIYVNSQQLLDISTLVIAGGSAPLYRFQMDGNNPGMVSAGTVVGSYLNKITNSQVRVVVHPNMPPGTILFWSDNIPYPLSNVGNVVVKKLRRDYYSIQWPLTRRRWEYGTYFDGVLQNYFPPAFGIINNITAGH